MNASSLSSCASGGEDMVIKIACLLHSLHLQYISPFLNQVVQAVCKIQSSANLIRFTLMVPGT